MLEIMKALSFFLLICGIMYLIMGTKVDSSEQKAALCIIVFLGSVFVCSATLIGMSK